MLTITDKGGRGVSQMLTIADKRGGGGLKNFQKRVLLSQKMWIERRIESYLTIHVNQSHVTCKLDPKK